METSCNFFFELMVYGLIYYGNRINQPFYRLTFIKQSNLFFDSFKVKRFDPMRFLFILILSVITLTSQAFSPIEARVDSVYDGLSTREKINQLIWLKVSNDSDLSALNEKMIQAYGGIYLNHPYQAFDEYIFNRGFIPSLAVQLDYRMNPAPEDLKNLPTLNTLSSLRDVDLLYEYLDFLKAIGKSYGINYMVMPEVNDSLITYQHLIGKMEAYDPLYFIGKRRVEFDLLDSRKELLHLFDYADFWVIPSPDIGQYEKIIKRFGKHLDFENVENTVKYSISNKYMPIGFPTKRKLPNKLSVELSRASIIPLQRNAGDLPLMNDTVCLITHEPFSLLAQMIGKYAYLITSKEGIEQSKSPIIIDNLFIDLSNFSIDDRKIIFLGSLQTGMEYGSNLDAGLFTSIENNMYSYLLPQLLFGSAEASGVMPVQLSIYSTYTNEPIQSFGILGYAPPEISGIDEMAQLRLREIIVEAIETGSTPGCQIAVVVDGAIVLEEGYGYLTYDSTIQTDNNTLYDLASVTKVSATLLAIMNLYDENLLNLDSAISTYLPAYAQSNKADITLRQLLSHNAGLISYVPFWKRTLGGEDRLETFYYETEEDEKIDNRSYGTKPSPALRDSLNSWILNSPLIKYDSLPGYNYSDIGFMILHQVVESITQTTMEDYLEEHFYGPLGLTRLQFNPMQHGIDRFEIAPTEYDYHFRNEQIWGQVHDRNAAVFGGVAGHAGLFSNSHDLIILLQMIAQNGQYGGKQYLKPATIDYFNDQYFPGNRRGLGWDKKSETTSNSSKKASMSSFGHTGFTGTLVWVDPAFDLVFVFLSNRIYPDANNYKLIQKDIRTRVQDVVYEAILSKWIN